ncbi:SRPBCC family protein [Nocardia aurantia]|uniref:SRPBCC family protein n=1 Tax=Nocardia aurantia TaxID=2585199 RepID=A0A7K0DX41_9NOCA|nr:SRPBCC family protein [Nocardia aurantia]MQY30341.1 hypothetical protein [Nocardia aurantia]
MRTMDIERTIAAPIDDVFDWLSDVTNYQRVPFIRRVTLVRPGSVAEHGVGAVRLIVTPAWRVTQEITEYDPPKWVRYRNLDSFPPQFHQDGNLTFTELPDGTRVRWHTEFEVSTPIFGPVYTLLLVAGFAMGLRLVLGTADRELRGI